MGLRDMFKRKSPEEVERERQRNYEREMARLNYEEASASRQLALAQRREKIGKMRQRAQKLASKESAIPDLYGRVAAALEGPPRKKGRKKQSGGYGGLFG